MSNYYNNRNSLHGDLWSPSPSQNSGSNQTQVGMYNERLLLDYVRKNPGVAAAQVSRSTGMSPQTVNGIVSRLLADKLLKKGARRNNGTVGQPAVSLYLNGNSVYSLGVKIGRTQSEVMLIDFTGTVQRQATYEHNYPDPASLIPWMREQIKTYSQAIDKNAQLIGTGIATFFGFGGWRDLFPIPEKISKKWEKIDLISELTLDPNVPAFLVNDATAACLAENELTDLPLTLAEADNALYIHIGTFVGGAVVINRQVFFGNNGNAGALASMPIGNQQLINHASLYVLKQSLKKQSRTLEDTDEIALKIIMDWRQDAAKALAQAISAAMAVLDFNHVVIGGEMSTPALQELTNEINEAFTPKLLQGLIKPHLNVGKQGARARCIGAAWLPMYINYSPTQAQLLKLKQLPKVTVQ